MEIISTSGTVTLTSFGSWIRTRFNIVVPGYWSDFRKSRRIRIFSRHIVKKILVFLVGAGIGLGAWVALVYLSGMALDVVGINLYASESDQQRNFNVFLVTSTVWGIVGGFLLVRKLARR